MTKGLKALGRIKNFLSQNCKHWKQDVGYIEEELKDGAKCKKALEIIKKSISDVTSLNLLLRELLLQRKITPDELGLLMEALK